MRVIDQSQIHIEGSSLNQLKGRFQGIMKYGLSWDADRKAEETIISELGKILDQQYTAIRHMTVPGLSTPIPLVLVGPIGVYVFYTSGAKGIFRAKGESWTEMNRSTRQYGPTRINPITRTLIMAKALETYLGQGERVHTPIQTALIFGNPGSHVDAVRPTVRVVLRDGIEHLAASLLQEQVALNSFEVHAIVETLTQPPKDNEPVKSASLEGTLGEAEEFAEPVQQPSPDVFERFVKKMGFTKRQWILLGVLVFFQAFILIVFLVLALTIL